MSITKQKRWRQLLAAMTSALVLTTAIGSKAEATEDLLYLLPMVVANAGDGINPAELDFDAMILGEVLGDIREAHANRGAGDGRAEAALNHFYAKALGTGPGGADARAFMEFVIHDPQARDLVKVRVGTKLASSTDRAFKGGATAAAPLTVNGSSSAGVSVRIAPNHSPFMVSFKDDGTVDHLEYPLPLLSNDDLYVAAAQVLCYYDGPEDAPVLTCQSDKGVYVNNVPVLGEQRASSTVQLNEFPTFSVRAGLYYVIGIEASANNGFAVIDPVVEPHPDNPDIVIEFPNAVEDPNPPPLMGDLTADALRAMGFDPQPFIDLGFLESASTPPPPPPPPPAGDTTPPTTTPSATPGANANGWNRTPVTVTLSATDNAGGSGVKEVHYSLAGASSGSGVVPGSSTTVTVSTEGTTTLTYFAVDNAGNQEMAKTMTVHIDQTPPTVTGLPSNCSLWPPDHALVQVATVSARDGLSGPAGPPTVTVTSNEPENGTGDGDLAPDFVISGGAVQVRAERAGNGSGRIYTITATASDLAGNTTTQTATCKVPHDYGRTAQH